MMMSQKFPKAHQILCLNQSLKYNFCYHHGLYIHNYSGSRKEYNPEHNNSLLRDTFSLDSDSCTPTLLAQG